MRELCFLFDEQLADPNRFCDGDAQAFTKLAMQAIDLVDYSGSVLARSLSSTQN